MASKYFSIAAQFSSMMLLSPVCSHEVQGITTPASLQPAPFSRDPLVGTGA